MGIGAFVRVSGSGMGCPDWPKCFGQWVPPTEESELPLNWRETYAALGADHLSFNAVRTWIEYTNRLFGVLTGLAVFGLAVASFLERKRNRMLFPLAIVALVLTGYQGWLGAQVVGMNLAHSMVSIHLFMAYLVLGILTVCLLLTAKRQPEALTSNTRLALAIFLGALLLQILMGALVRGEIDQFADAMGLPAEHLSKDYLPIHRSFSIIVFGIGTWAFFKWREQKVMGGLLVLAASCLLLQIISGTVLNSLGLKGGLQILHVVLASSIFAAVIYAGAAGLAIAQPSGEKE